MLLASTLLLVALSAAPPEELSGELSEEASAPPIFPAPAGAAVASPALEPDWPLWRGDTRRFNLPRRPVPHGYRLVRETDWALVGGGIGVFVLSTAPMVLYALTSGRVEYAVPGLGQIVGIVESVRSAGSGGLFSGLAPLAVAILAVDLVAQAIGVVMIAVGFERPARWLERDARAAPRVMLMPGVAGSPAGASLLGRF